MIYAVILCILLAVICMILIIRSIHKHREMTQYELRIEWMHKGKFDRKVKRKK